MFNECLIHLCDCTWLNALHLLNLMLIKHKNIFECFNCFWKVFCFENFQKFKNCATLFWQLYLTGQASREPLVTSLCRSSWQLSGRSRPQSRKRLRKLSKFWVFSIFATQFGDLFASGSSSRKSYSEWFVTPVTTYSQVDLPVEKNT